MNTSATCQAPYMALEWSYTKSNMVLDTGLSVTPLMGHPLQVAWQVAGVSLFLREPMRQELSRPIIRCDVSPATLQSMLRILDDGAFDTIAG